MSVMEVIKTTQTTVFYTVKTPNGEQNFSTAWQTIAFLSNINLETQKN